MMKTMKNILEGRVEGLEEKERSKDEEDRGRSSSKD